MMLHENQLKLLHHLARFHQLAYEDCLAMLDVDGTGDRTALSYVFRPLTKNRYVSKRKDGCVTILAKGRELFPEVTPLIAAGSGEAGRRRVMEVSRMAALMERHGIYCTDQLPTENKKFCFIPSACWREIASGVLSTTRFTGMLIAGERRLAIYDIGDGKMEWQVRAEGSLFYTKYGRYETRATGMLLMCQKEAKIKAARNIIRQTMWHRRQLLAGSCAERSKPTRWSRSPIKLKAEYRHAYLTTPEELEEDLTAIFGEEEQIRRQRCEAHKCSDPAQGDYEDWPYRYFVNPATDLLKYVYYFAAAKSLNHILETRPEIAMPLRYALCVREKDYPILRMYPDTLELEGTKFYVYQSE